MLTWRVFSKAKASRSGCRKNTSRATRPLARSLSGTAWECGYAYAKGKPIVCYRTDFRITGDTEGAPYNLMLSESATARFEAPFRTKPEEFRWRVLEQIRKVLAAGGGS